jgi:hypothetical protein
MELFMNSFQNYFTGIEPYGKLLSLDRSIKPNDMLYPKRLTLYDEIYIGHTPVTRIGKTEPVQWLVSGTWIQELLLKDL